jgi:hypothetical protein
MASSEGFCVNDLTADGDIKLAPSRFEKGFEFAVRSQQDVQHVISEFPK